MPVEYPQGYWWEKLYPTTLTHCGLVMPYDDTDKGYFLLRLSAGPWWHQAINWTKVDFIKGI